MKTVFVCIKKHPRLTVGKKYGSIIPARNALNVVVYDDHDQPSYFARYEFFKELSAE